MPSSHASNHFGLAAFLVFYYNDDEWKKLVVVMVMGVCDLLCAGICGKTFSR